MKAQMFKLKNGRVCFDFPWESKSSPQPWKQGYRRVLVPLSEKEKMNSNKKVHIQIVAQHNLEAVRENRLQIR